MDSRMTPVHTSSRHSDEPSHHSSQQRYAVSEAQALLLPRSSSLHSKRESKASSGPWESRKRQKSLGYLGVEDEAAYHRHIGRIQPLTPLDPHYQGLSITADGRSSPSSRLLQSIEPKANPYHSSPQEKPKHRHHHHHHHHHNHHHRHRDDLWSVGSWCEPEPSERNRLSHSHGYPEDGMLSPDPEDARPSSTGRSLAPMSNAYQFVRHSDDEADRINRTWYLSGRAKMDAQLANATDYIAAMRASGNRRIES